MLIRQRTSSTWFLHKRSASSDGVEEPPKRQRMGSHPRSQTVQEVTVTAFTTDSDSEIEESNDGKEKTSTSAIIDQGDPYLSPPSSFE